MYAIIATGGKQHKVAVGEVIQVEKLAADVGAKIDFDSVLMIADGDNATIGTPNLGGAKVVGEVVEQGRGEKISIIKFRRRKHHIKRQGHRQDYTAVKINEIIGN